jgi:hypothetical protein
MVAAALLAALGCVAFWSLGVACAQQTGAATEEPEPVDLSDSLDAGVPALPPVAVQLLVRDAAAPVASGRGVLVTAGEVYDRVADAPEPVQRAWAASPQSLDDLVVSDPPARGRAGPAAGPDATAPPPGCVVAPRGVSRARRRAQYRP